MAWIQRFGRLSANELAPATPTHPTYSMTIAQETARSLVVIGVTASLLLLWIVAYVDLARRKDLSVVKKLLWAAAMFFGVYVGIAAYFVMRPIPEVIGKGDSSDTSESSVLVGDLESLRSSHAEGSVSDVDYLAKKRNLLGLV